MDTPTSLFKYRSLATDNTREHVREMFEYHMVWFSSCKDFNDPFEFDFTPSFEATTEEKIEKIAQVLQKEHPSLFPNDSAKKVVTLECSSPANISEIEQELDVPTRFSKSLDEEFSVFSLTEYKDNILMWSHYADSHKGICVEFKPDKENKEHVEFYDQAIKVTYPENKAPFQLNFYKYGDDPREWAEYFLARKAFDWKYEGEWRIIDVKRGRGKRHIPEGIISSVILGYRIGEEESDFIMGLATAYPTPITIYKAGKKAGCYGCYGLEIQKCCEV